MPSLEWKIVCIVISFLVHRTIYSSSSPSISGKVRSISQRRHPKCLSLEWDSCCRAWFGEAFSLGWNNILSMFPSSSFVWWCSLPIFPSDCNLVFSKGSDSFLTWQFYNFRYMSFSTSYYYYGTIFFWKFHSYIQVLYSFICIQFFWVFFQTAWCYPY